MEYKRSWVEILLHGLIIILVIILAFFIYLQFNIDAVGLDFYLKGDDTIKLEAGEEYIEPGYVAKFNKSDYTDEVKIDSSLDTNVPGKYYIRYTINLKYLGLSKIIQRKINVVDTTPPELVVDSEKELHIPEKSEYTMPKYKAIDTVDGNITDKVKVDSNLDLDNEGVYEINYSITDSSGNKSEDKITIYVEGKNAYITVSIANQRLDYYEYGKIVLSSDVVTGINNGTPRGTFRVLNKARNTTLTGADYTSFVNYWIAFKGYSYGLHDASWRNTFGGNIYKYNGSHGCVNMPYTKVKQLYEMVEIGTPVYIN